LVPNARRLGAELPEPFGAFALLMAETSLRKLADTQPDRYVMTHSSDLRRRLAGMLKPQLGLALRSAGERRDGWDLDERSEERLSDWIELNVEVGWRLPPRALRGPLAAVCDAIGAHPFASPTGASQ
jgi:hypothetical protein